MNRLDTLSLRLLAAIDKNDLEAIARLKADGAKAEHPVATEEGDNEITPVFHAIVTEKSHLIEPLIGTGWQTVPLGMVLSMGREYDLYEAIVDRCESFLYTDSVEALSNCLDVAAPAVANAMWNAASMALDPINDNPYPTSALIDCATTILWEGGYPDKAIDYLRVLGIQTDTSNDGEMPILFLDNLGPEYGHMYDRWFKHGLSPDARVCGMPLLHTFAYNDWSQLVALALEAGADLSATCSYAQFDLHCPAMQRKQQIPAGQPVSVVDAAQEGDSAAVLQLIEAHRARVAINGVLTAARAARSM